MWQHGEFYIECFSDYIQKFWLETEGNIKNYQTQMKLS